MMRKLHSKQKQQGENIPTPAACLLKETNATRLGRYYLTVEAAEAGYLANSVVVAAVPAASAVARGEVLPDS